MLTSNSEDYLPYCLESLDWVDEVVVVDADSTDETLAIASEYNSVIVSDDSKNYSQLRNHALGELRRLNVDWVMWLDSDEILCKYDGRPVDRETVENIIKGGEADSFNVFTRHYLWNYYTLDGRNNGEHWSKDRLFKLSVDAEFTRPLHEHLQHQRRQGQFDPLLLVIHHFAMCRGVEAYRDKLRKYIEMDVPSDPFRHEYEGRDTEEYIWNHPHMSGRTPVIRFNGPHPDVLKLWKPR